MSKRSTIFNTIHEIIAASTYINHVTANDENGWEWSEDKYPGAVIQIDDETKSRFAFSDGSTSMEDMQSEFYVNVIGFVRSAWSTDIEARKGEMINDIETSIVSDSTLGGLVADIIAQTEDSDHTVYDGIGWVTVRFKGLYFYNHADV